MRTDGMSDKVWRQVQTEIHDNIATFQGRKILYIKPGEMEWFENEKEAIEQGFHPAQLSEIHALASKQLQDLDLAKLESEFSALIDVRKGLNLLTNPNTPPENLHLHGMFLVAKAKKVGSQECKEMGQKCLEKAVAKFIENGNVAKANICKKLLVQSVEFTKEHPLYNLNALTDVDHTASTLTKGVYVPNLDSGHLKNGVLKLSRRMVDEQTIDQLSFKISYPARNDLETQLEFVETNLEAFKSGVCKGLCSDVVITRKAEQYLPFHDGAFHSGEAMEIIDGEVIEMDFVGLGKLRVGSNKNIGCGYNRIELEFPSDLPAGQTLEATQKMLNAIGLSVDLHECANEDIERRKVMTMFHVYYPRQAFQFENRMEGYTLNSTDLKKEIALIEPGMQEIFDHYEQNPDLVSEQEIYPGKMGIALLDVPDKIRETGGVGLIVGVPYGNVVPRLTAMLKTGPLASQDRYEAGLLVNGASSGTDYLTGGGDSVFTRMVTETSIADEVSISTYQLSGRAQILVDLDVLARGGYAYIEDAYGAKNRFGDHESYENRMNLWECTAQVNISERNLYANEFMVKNHIPPSVIRGVVVADANMKRNLIEEMRNAGLIVEQEGQELINGKPIDEFIHVDRFFRKEMWEK